MTAWTNRIVGHGPSALVFAAADRVPGVVRPLNPAPVERVRLVLLVHGVSPY